MSRLQQIEYSDGSKGFQEIDESGKLLRLYDADGEQRARMADADRYPHVEWQFVKDLGEFSDSDEFWSLVEAASGNANYAP